MGLFNVSDVKASQKTIAEKIIRFHVLANSDTPMDQSLKLKVKDRVISYTSKYLGDCKDLQSFKKELLKHNENIKTLAEKIIKEAGYTYKVTTELSREDFPIKTYGDVTLPEGNYEAYRILIGKAEGQNWWCVMFPPLCFIDLTKGNIANEETDTSMGKVLNSNELKLVKGSETNKVLKQVKKPSTDNKIEFRFKIVDILKSLIKKS